MKNRGKLHDTRLQPGPFLAGALVVALLGAAGPLQAATEDPAAKPARAGKKADLSKMDEILETQKSILERLDAQDKILKDILQKMQAAPQVAARPQIDPNKVYAIPVGNTPFRGPKDARVTVVEFSDYQ